MTKEWRLPQPESRENRDPKTRSYKRISQVVVNLEEYHNTRLGPILAYVVNFSAEDLHPHTFWFPRCMKKLVDGTTCKKSLQFGSNCGHDAFAEGCVTDIYRFEVALCDALDDGQSMPLRCKILEAASVLLGVEVKTFQEWTEEAQDHYVRQLILHMPLCEVYMRVLGGEAIVDTMNWSFPPLNRPLSPYLPGTERHYLPLLAGTSADGRPDGRTHEIEAVEDDPPSVEDARPAASWGDDEGAVPCLIKAFSKWAKRRLRRLQN